MLADYMCLTRALSPLLRPASAPVGVLIGMSFGFAINLTRGLLR
jgi:hypothetical protein